MYAHSLRIAAEVFGPEHERVVIRTALCTIYGPIDFDLAANGHRLRKQIRSNKREKDAPGQDPKRARSERGAP